MEAVKDDIGGSNPALAQAIAKDHLVCNHILISIVGNLVAIVLYLSLHMWKNSGMRNLARQFCNAV